MSFNLVLGLCLCTCNEVFWIGAVDVASDVMQGDATVVTIDISGFRVVSKRESALMKCGWNKTWKTNQEHLVHTIKTVKCKLLCISRPIKALTGTWWTWGEMVCVGGLDEVVRIGEADMLCSWAWMAIGWTFCGEVERLGIGWGELCWVTAARTN